MSEELLQTIPQQIGKYTYYRLGNTTLSQLRDGGIIPKRDYRDIERKRPDGLVAHHGDIKAVVEYKQPKDLTTERLIKKAIAQELPVAKALCKVMIVTDGSKTFWVNALTGDRIRDVHGQELRTVFHPFLAKNTTALESLLDEVTASVSKTNSTIRSAKVTDPTPLAARLWQTIWVATGKSPVKCLYNVVELFIFKFLSDLKVLDDDIAFANIRKKAIVDPEVALDFYARVSRTRIYQLFPEGKDGTTIINGTIFVNENGEPNLSQSILFQRSLEHLYRYGEEFGSLTRINKQFKTKLYESFLQQEVEALGQYFTPRRVVQSMIRMAGMDVPSFQFADKRICDPFCGVGGFPLELLNMNESMFASYRPDQACEIHPSFVLHGFDKGFERDDERTIILAKANMLIYLAELLFKNPQCSRQFASIFNETFTLFKDNLGTFGHIIKNEADKYDYILSNPPYVTSGSSIIKEEIQKTPRTAKEYPVNALGLEGLSIEWIVRSLKKGGRAFLVIPDGILGRIGGKKLRDHLLRECYLDAIVSLPVRTFFPNFEHTYIIALTRKHSPDDLQTDPVFTYVVSNIGERLTSVKREEIEEDDLPEMERLFRVFLAGRIAFANLLEQQSGRCKIQPIERFRAESHWVINRWWTRDERIALGISESEGSADKLQVDTILAELNHAIGEYDPFVAGTSLNGIPTMTVSLGDPKRFNLLIGRRILVKNVAKERSSQRMIPAYSANVREPMGYVERSRITDFSHPVILWGIDGNFEFNLLPAGEKFETTDHCGTIRILVDDIVPEYLLSALYRRRVEETFDRSFRASLANMRQFAVEFPVKPNGKLDVDAQRRLAAEFTGATLRREGLAKVKERLNRVLERYIGA